MFIRALPLVAAVLLSACGGADNSASSAADEAETNYNNLVVANAPNFDLCLAAGVVADQYRAANDPVKSYDWQRIAQAKCDAAAEQQAMEDRLAASLRNLDNF